MIAIRQQLCSMHGAVCVGVRQVEAVERRITRWFIPIWMAENLLTCIRRLVFR